MSMGTSEAVLHVLSGAVPLLSSRDVCSSNSDLLFSSKYHIKSVKKKGSRYLQSLKCSIMTSCQIGSYRCKRLGGGLYGNTGIDRLKLLSCKCQQSEIEIEVSLLRSRLSVAMFYVLPDKWV